MIRTTCALALFVAGTVVASAQDGIGVTRARMKKALGSAFAFTPGTPSNGHENLSAMATDGSNAVVQMVGPDGELVRASIMAYRDASAPKAWKKAETHVKSFLKLFAPDAWGWITSTLKRESATEAWTRQSTTNGVTLTLMYTPTGNSYAIVIEASRAQ